MRRTLLTNILIHTSNICNSVSFDRQKRDGVFVTWGVEPWDILCIFELAILIQCTLVRVRLRGHIN